MSTLDDTAAIRAVKIAYAMHLPSQIHPTNKSKEFAQKKDDQEAESDVGEGNEDYESETEGGNDTESCTDEEEDGGFRDERDGGGSSGDDGDDTSLKSSVLEVLRSTLCPFLSFLSTILSSPPPPSSSSSSSSSSSPSPSPSTASSPSSSPSSHNFPYTFSFTASAFHGAEATHSPYKIISRGACCTVYSASPLSAVKISSDPNALWNDVQLTELVHEAWKAHKALLRNFFPKSRLPRAPSVHRSFSKELLPQWWATHVNLLPEHEKGTHVFFLQRIPAIPSAAVSAILALHPHKWTDCQTTEMREGHACLIRPCLGIRGIQREKQYAKPTLWNYPLYLDQLLQIVSADGVKCIAKEMALGLALLHWGADVDGMGAEFVLGAPEPDVSSLPHEASKSGRKTQMWILDFDKASLLDWSDWDCACGKMIAAVTASNDPCFPAPHSELSKAGVDRAIRAAFEEVYIKASKLLIDRSLDLAALAGRAGGELKREETMGWPEQFVRAWKARSRK